jgi:hypothetical protein
VAQLGTILIREWINEADGLPMQQEATLPGSHKRVSVCNYNQAAGERQNRLRMTLAERAILAGFVLCG